MCLILLRYRYDSLKKEFIHKKERLQVLNSYKRTLNAVGCHKTLEGVQSISSIYLLFFILQPFGKLKTNLYKTIFYIFTGVNISDINYKAVSKICKSIKCIMFYIKSMSKVYTTIKSILRYHVLILFYTKISLSIHQK